MGIEEFNQYYSEIYGERWPRLREALTGKDLKVARRNLWLSDADFFKRHPTWQEIPTYIDDCWRITDSIDVASLVGVAKEKEISRSDEGLLDYYVMDPASVLTARALPLENAERVLDLCAAPGGKSLILFERASRTAEMWSNEFSPGRREQLIRVVKQYIAFSERQRLWVKGMNGEKFGLKHPDQFDSILVDAPCSGERHLLENFKEMGEWSVKRGKNLSRRQFSLVSSAWLALKSGGYLLYSTCSINPLENEKLMAEFFDRRGQDFKFQNIESEIPGEPPKGGGPGMYFLPDECGFGPMYLCLLRKN